MSQPLLLLMEIAWSVLFLEQTQLFITFCDNLKKKERFRKAGKS